MASNHSNLYNKLLDLVLGCYVVPHAEVNSTEYGGEGITGTGTESAVRRDGTGPEQGKGESGASGAVSRGGGLKGVRW